MFEKIIILAIMSVVKIMVSIAETVLITSKDISGSSANQEKGQDKGQQREHLDIVSKMLYRPSRYLESMNVLRVLLRLGITILFTVFFMETIELYLIFLGVLLIHIITEYVPKKLVFRQPETLLRKMSFFIRGISVLIWPLLFLFFRSTDATLKALKVQMADEDRNTTEEEILILVDAGEEKGILHESEKEMINNIFEFNDMIVEDIMIHRTDVTAIQKDATIDEAIELFQKEKYSRIPIYENDMDNIVGVLHIKDLIDLAVHQKHALTDRVDTYLREAFYVPTSKKTEELFREMKKNKVHMAIVIDEYGGTAGIVTIEDLLEEIVGNIFDEYDDDEVVFEKIDEESYIVDGTTDLETVAEHFGVKLPIDDYETISGFLISQIGRIPNLDEVIKIEQNDLVFEAFESNEKIIQKVKIAKNKQKEDLDDEGIER